MGVEAGRNQVTAREHYEREKESALSACSGAVGTAAVECATKAVEAAQQKSETRQDLYAQQDAARWNWWAMIAAWTAVFITGLGVWFVKKTLDATWKAVKETGEATKAMARQNEMAQASQRAWMYLREVQTTTLGPGDINGTRVDGALNFEVMMANYGNTPAITIVSSHVFQMIMRNDPNPCIEPKLPDDGQGAAAPGKDLEIYQFILSGPNLAQFRSGERDISLTIRCGYFDVFSDASDSGQRHETSLHLRLSHGAFSAPDKQGVRHDRVRVETTGTGFVRPRTENDGTRHREGG